MRQATGRQILTESNLGAIVEETEAVVNLRPLVSLSEESVKVPSPADFLSPRISLGMRLSSEEEDDFTWLPGNASMADKLLERWRKTVNTLDKFWKICYEKYLTALRGELKCITDREKESPEKFFL